MARLAVVLDTNIFVAAGFNPDSAAARIIASVRAGQLAMPWHPTTRRETRAVLCQIPPLHWAAFADVFWAEVRVTQPLDLAPFKAVADAADRKFAALAYQTQALLVSNDQDLLSVRDELPVTVLTSSAFATRYLPD